MLKGNYRYQSEMRDYIKNTQVFSITVARYNRFLTYAFNKVWYNESLMVIFDDHHTLCQRSTNQYIKWTVFINSNTSNEI